MGIKNHRWGGRFASREDQREERGQEIKQREKFSRIFFQPPPTFSWWKDGKQIVSNDEFQVENEEYQGGSTAILQIFKTQMHDAGTYTLRGENRNGSDKVDLDLVVLDTSHDIECEMLKNANLECRCSQSFR